MADSDERRRDVEKNELDRRAFEVQRRRRSIAIALALGGLVLLFYVATIVRMGGSVLNRPL